MMFNEFIAIIIGFVRYIVVITGVVFFISFLKFAGNIVESTNEIREMFLDIGFSAIGFVLIGGVCYLVSKYLGKIQEYFWEK
jgi:hypothetical protein